MTRKDRRAVALLVHELAGDRRPDLLKKYGCSASRCLTCLGNQYGDALPPLRTAVRVEKAMKRSGISLSKSERNLMSDLRAESKDL